MALPRARNLAFMFVRYRFSIALWAAFLRFIIAAASGSFECVERVDLLFAALKEAVIFGEVRGEEEDDDDGDDSEALEVLRELLALFLKEVGMFSFVGLATSVDNGDVSLS